MVRITILANNQKWKTWDKKTQALKDWFKPVIDLEFEVIHTSFKDIPFSEYVRGKIGVDKTWYKNNITPFKKDHIILSVPIKQWKGKSTRGWHTTNGEMQVSADEFGNYEYKGNKYTGGRWFNIARHEITHALYDYFKLPKDNTHYWFEIGKLEETIKEFKGKNEPVNHILIAMDEIGVTEFKGEANNPRILQYAKDCGIPYTSDDTAWCSLFVNWVALKSKLPRTNKLNARSWLDIGTKVTTPKVGDVCVFWREHKDSWKGHVGFYMTGNDKQIAVLGGNQGDSVSVKFYPTKQLLGYRRLI